MLTALWYSRRIVGRRGPTSGSRRSARAWMGLVTDDDRFGGKFDEPIVPSVKVNKHFAPGDLTFAQVLPEQAFGQGAVVRLKRRIPTHPNVFNTPNSRVEVDNADRRLRVPSHTIRIRSRVQSRNVPDGLILPWKPQRREAKTSVRLLGKK